MKKNIFLFLISFLPFLSSAQEQERKNEWGDDLLILNSQLSKTTFIRSAFPNYTSLHTNASGNGILWYKREFRIDTSHFYFYKKTGILYGNQFGDVVVDTVHEARVYEEFYKIPFMIGMKLSSGKNTSFNLGFGLCYNIISKQQFFAAPGATLPATYQKTNGFNAYSKLGFASEMNVHILLSRKVFFDIGIWSDSDLSVLSSSRSVLLTTIYRSFGTSMGFGILF